MSNAFPEAQEKLEGILKHYRNELERVTETQVELKKEELGYRQTITDIEGAIERLKED